MLMKLDAPGAFFDLARVIHGAVLEPAGRPVVLQWITERDEGVIGGGHFLNRLAAASSATKERAEEAGTGRETARRPGRRASEALIALVLTLDANAPREDRS